MSVFVISRVRFVRFNHRRIARFVSTVLSSIGESSSELSLTFVGDRRMQHLNYQYRRKDCATDVLAFAARDVRIPRCEHLTQRFLGDVVIAAPTAMRQARQEHRSLDEEVAALIVHGVLHLCGYDHEQSASEARRMFRREHLILRQLGRIPRFTHVAVNR